MTRRTATSAGLRRATLPLLALVLLAVAGCGGSSSSSSSAGTAPASGGTTAPAGGGQALHLAANPEGQLKYDKTSLTAKAGTVTIDFTNQAPVAHNLTIESASGSQLGATPTFEGGTKTLSLSLKPGTYKFFCTVPGHRQAGMEGTLTVQ